jgi:hypothetical protein
MVQALLINAIAISPVKTKSRKENKTPNRDQHQPSQKTDDSRQDLVATIQHTAIRAKRNVNEISPHAQAKTQNDHPTRDPKETRIVP